jgi:hypothetical protein
MKKAGFIVGYAGGILALICALLMIYTVPASLADSVVQGIGSDLENENIVAMGEMFLQDEWPPLSRGAYEDFAAGVADDSRLPLDDNVYQQSALFIYRAGVNAVVSAVSIAVSIVAAFVAFFGALAVRKRSMAAGVMMLVSALLLLVAAVYTGTAMPTVLSCLLLAAAGVIAFVPEKGQAPARAGFQPYVPPEFPEDDAEPTRMSREREAPKDRISVRVRRNDDID